MTRSIGPRLPETLASLLNGERLATKIGIAFQCITTTQDGWPYLALVSVGELLAVSPTRLRLAIWSGSTSDRNLEREQRCALALVHAHASYMIRCRASLSGSLDQTEGPGLSVFSLNVEDVLEDMAPYATLTSGVTYELHDRDAVVAGWRSVISRLKKDFALPSP
ncbi:MAG TPA: pyridoxamine 5'-phosphate oxidase family protein [Chloroflexota bacterium]|nr:pyridoxamine 5'-phosphate oxidase family protein [Chloroflexota bacterium]